MSRMSRRRRQKAPRCCCRCRRSAFAVVVLVIPATSVTSGSVASVGVHRAPSEVPMGLLRHWTRTWPVNEDVCLPRRPFQLHSKSVQELGGNPIQSCDALDGVVRDAEVGTDVWSVAIVSMSIVWG